MIQYEKYIRDIKDFPTKGVVFKDITPLLNTPKIRQQMLSDLLLLCDKLKIDKVVGIEARGFFFGMQIADALNVGFAPIRKKGKLPHTTVSQSYGLEYGEDVMEIHKDAIEKGDRVLIHDDVLATGGTAAAACKLVEQLGGTVVQLNFLMELSFLNGSKKLEGHKTAAVITY